MTVLTVSCIIYSTTLHDMTLVCQPVSDWSSRSKSTVDWAVVDFERDTSHHPQCCPNHAIHFFSETYNWLIMLLCFLQMTWRKLCVLTRTDKHTLGETWWAHSNTLKKTLQELQKAALRVTLLSRCQGVFTKRCHYNFFCHYSHFYYYHNLSFWVVTIYFFLVLHDLSFWDWLQDLLSFVAICFLSFVTVWVLEFCRNLGFFSVDKTWKIKL